jgi:F-type H+-transporting ATPase subunit delta
LTRSAPGTARRYARALLDVALEKGNAEAVRAELQTTAGLIAGHADLSALLAHPAVSAERKRKLVGAVAAKAGVSELLARLLALMGERDRLALLPMVAAAYTKLWNAHRGVVAAQAVSATPLDEAQTRAVAKALAAATGREVDLEARVDPRLLGGMLVHMEGRTYDGSVRARLIALRRAMMGTPGSTAGPRQPS